MHGVLGGVDIREYPVGYQGRKRYVTAVDAGIVAACHTYRGNDGRNYVLGDDRGYAKISWLPTPYVVRDIGEYTSPIDNSRITSRSAHREHLKLHDVIEVGNERLPAPRPNLPTVSFGESIKQRLEEVRAMPQSSYDTYVHTQQAEHSAIVDTIVAS